MIQVPLGEAGFRERKKDEEVRNSIQEKKFRQAKLSATLEEKGLAGVLIYSSMLRRENLRYFSGFNPMEPGAVVFFFPPDFSLLLVPTKEERARARVESWIERVESYSGDLKKIPALVTKIATGKKWGVVGWDYLSAELMLALLGSFPGVDWVDFTPAVNDIRMIKTESEIRKIERAARIADAAFENLLEDIEPGMKEYEIIARVERLIRKAGGEDNFQILASGEGDARAMHPPTDRMLKEGDLVLTEISPQFDGYYAQICRSMVIGDASAERRKAHGILARAQESAIRQVRPGMTASELAKIENDVFRDEGFGEFVSEKYTRGRGHGIGLYIDEEPLIAEGNHLPLKQGMVVMIHPNTYLPMSGYLVLGDPVLITDEGGRRLSRSRRDLVAVPCQREKRS